MEYCSPLWAGAPASHLSWLHAVETKAFRIIGISRNEAVFGSLTQSPQVGRWSFCLLPSPTVSSPVSPPLLSLRFVPTSFPQGAQGPPTTPFWENYQNHESLLTFTLSFLFSPAFGINSHTVFNPILPSRPSKQLFTTTSYHPPSKSSIFSTPDNYPSKPTSFKFPAFLPESPCNVHLVFPMFPTPSHSLPQIS